MLPSQALVIGVVLGLLMAHPNVAAQPVVVAADTSITTDLSAIDEQDLYLLSLSEDTDVTVTLSTEDPQLDLKIALYRGASDADLTDGNRTGFRRLGGGDHDLFEVSLTAESTITLTLSGLFDGVILLYTESSVAVAFDISKIHSAKDEEESGEEMIVTTLSAGNYLVSVFGSDGGEIGTYSLSLQVDDPAPAGDSPVPLVLGDAISDSLENPTDVSLFLLTLDVESEILAELTLDAAFDGVITIYRGEAASDTTIANLVVTADAALEGESEILKQPLTSGTYVVLINSFGSTSSGAFTLTVTAEPAVLTPVTRGETTEGELSISGEVDLYAFTVSEMETITATLEGSFDAILFLYSGSTVADVLDISNLLIEADDPEVITRTLEAGAYTLIVSSFGRSSTGTYTLQLETTGGSSAPATDFDGDGSVGFSDFLSFATAFGSTEDSDGFDPRFDLDGDGQVGFSDFLQFAITFGT